jgi:hypothetical protein
MSRALGLFLISILIFSSCTQKKDRSGLRFIPRTEFGYRGAIDRTIQLKFNVNQSDVSEVSAVVQAPENYKGTLNFKWSLGDGVQLESGKTDGQIKIEKSKIVLQIKVKNFTSEKLKHIRFEISGDHAGRRIFADGIISSQQKNSFEDIVKEIETYKKDNLNDK